MNNLKRFPATMITAALILVAVACKDKSVSPTSGQTASVDIAAEQKAIQQLLDAYSVALNASDAAKVTPLFAQDGVLAAPGVPTATGQAQIRAAYDGIFNSISLKLQFTPAQIVVASTTYAFATSTSSGPLLSKATGQSAPNSYRELWAFVKENNQWRIARYYFNQP